MIGKVSKEQDNDLKFLRLFFASLVWIGHSYGLSFEDEPWIGKSYSIATFGVFGFFTLSGYLITNSYLNLNSLFKYLVNRVLRIFPALIIAVVMGGILAFLTIDPGSRNSDLLQPILKYLFSNATMLDLRANTIPGAFSENRIQLVNASLWTLPVEARLYLLVGLFGWAGLLNARALLCVLVILCISDYASLKNSVLLYVVEPSEGQSVYSVLFFFSGMIFRIIKIETNIYFFAATVLISIYSTIFNGIPDIVQIFCLAYVILYSGYRANIFRNFFNRIGDYSYGIYVYAFPIQQFVWYVAKHHFDYQLSPWLLIGLSGLVLFPVAILSWHFLESYFLSLKDRLIIQKRAALI